MAIPKHDTGTKRGRADLHSKPSVRKLQALAMLQRRIQNKTNTAIAQEFNCHPDTVGRILTWAERQGLYQEARDQILRDMVPTAIEVYARSLALNVQADDPELDAARDVLHGMGVLKRKGSPMDDLKQGEDTLEKWFENRAKLKELASEGEHESAVREP